MLQLIRDRAQGWLAWVIVILICVPFALWGIQEYFGVDPNVPVAEVDGQEIGLNAFNAAYQRDRIGQRNNADSDDPALQQRRRRDFVERMIGDEVMVQSATDAGLRISDAQLAASIRSTPTFHQDGRFSQPYYESFLRNYGFSPGNFEYYQRRAMVVGQLGSAVSDSAFSADFETKAILELQAQRRSFSTLVVNGAQLDDIEPTEEELVKYYEDNSAAFRSPEQVELSYAVLSKADLARAVEADEEALAERFASRPEAYTPPQERRLRHILVELAADADESAEAQARSKIEAARARMEGESFEAVAEDVSDDASSAKQGGSLGAVGKGFMDPAFEAAAFAQEAGVLGEVVRSPFGLHVIRVDEVIGGGTPQFSDVRDDVLEDYRREQAEKLYYELGARLKDITFTDSLEQAAEDLGLKVEKTPFVDRNGIPGHPVAGDPRVMRAAFSEQVLGERLNSDVLDHLDGVAVVVRVDDHRPSAERPLEQVRDEVLAAARAHKGANAARALGETLVRELRAGLEPEAAATRSKSQWTQFTAVTRGAREPHPDASTLAFKMPRPGEDKKPVFDGIDASTADQFVIVMLESVDSTSASADASESRIAEALARDAGQLELRGLIDSLRAKADVKIYESRL